MSRQNNFRNSRRPRGPSRYTRAESKRSAAMDLPSLDNNITVRKKLRFQVTSDSNGFPVVLTEKDLSIAGGVVNFSPTEAYRLFAQFRLERVEAWAPHPVAGVTTLSIETAPTAVTNTTFRSDSSINVSVPAHVIVNMPNPRVFVSRDSTTGDYSLNPVVNIYCPKDTIVDLTFTFKSFDPAVPVAALYLHNAQIGRTTYPTLGITGPSTFDFVPVGRPS